MTTNLPQTNRSFRTAIINIILISVAIFFSILGKGKNSDTSAFFVGLPILVTGILGIVGTFQVIKALKEGWSVKLLVALFINAGLALLFMAAIVMNIMDIKKVL